MSRESRKLILSRDWIRQLATTLIEPAHTAPPRQETSNVNRLLRRAMQQADNFVIEMDYSDSKGNQTHRVVSPIRFMGSHRFLGLCLCREQPRQFQLSRCKNLKLIPAEDVLMPIPMSASTNEVAMGV